MLTANLVVFSEYFRGMVDSDARTLHTKQERQESYRCFHAMLDGVRVVCGLSEGDLEDLNQYAVTKLLCR